MRLTGTLWEAAACPAGWHREGLTVLPRCLWWATVRINKFLIQEDKTSCDFSPRGSITIRNSGGLCSAVNCCVFCTIGFVQASFFLNQQSSSVRACVVWVMSVLGGFQGKGTTNLEQGIGEWRPAEASSYQHICTCHEPAAPVPVFASWASHRIGSLQHPRAGRARTHPAQCRLMGKGKGPKRKREKREKQS